MHEPDPPTEAKKRQAALWRARTQAQQILAKRYPKEFMELKNQILARWGFDPIEQEQQNRVTAVIDPRDEPPVSR